MKKTLGPIMAVLIAAIVIVGGYFLGKYVSKYFHEKMSSKEEVEKEVTIIKEDVEIDYPLNDGTKTLAELCGKDTGICNTSVGHINLNDVELNLRIYTNFDNPDDDALTYFTLNDVKIGSFVYLSDFVIIDNNYLLVTELNSNTNNYVIHIYDHAGKEVASYAATMIRNGYEVNGDNLYYYYCSNTDTIIEEELPLSRVSYFKVNADNITEKIEESFEYKECA